MGPSPQPPKESAPNKHLSFQQLEACFASLPDAIVVWDWTGKILFLNTAAYTLFEVPASDSWVGTSAQQFFQQPGSEDEQQRPFVFAPWLLDQTILKEETGSCFSDPQPFVLGLLPTARCSSNCSAHWCSVPIRSRSGCSQSFMRRTRWQVSKSMVKNQASLPKSGGASGVVSIGEKAAPFNMNWIPV